MARSNAAGNGPRTPYREAMKHLIHERWESVWQAIPAAIEGGDPEGVHDVRVASRRLRAAMDVAVEAFPADWYKPLHRVAREITSELGEVRDREVQIEYMVNVRESLPPGEQVGIDRLIARLGRERDSARTEMLEYLSNLERKNVRGQVDHRFGPSPESTPSQLGKSE